MAVTVLVVVVVAGALLLAEATGSFGIPHNDDWSYSRSALEYARTGELRMYGWGQMFLVGQVLTSAPLLLVAGPSQQALQVYGALAAVLLLACTYLLAARAVSRWRAVVLVAIVSLYPGFALWTASYMTDLPAGGAALLALVLGAHAVRSGDWRWLVASMAAGFWAFTIRETMVVAVLAVSLTAVLRRGVAGRFRVLAGGLTVVVCAGGAALESYRRGMANGDPPPYGLSDLHLGLPETLVSAYLMVGLAVLPLLLWVGLRLRPRDLVSPGRLLGWVLGVLAAVHVGALHRGTRLLPRNHLEVSGAYWDAMVGGQVVALDSRLWQIVQYLGVLGGVLLGGEIGAALSRPVRLMERARQWEPAQAATVLFGVLLAGVSTVLSLAGQEQWDRYALILVPCAGIALLRLTGPGSRPGRMVAATAAVAAAALVGTVSWYVAAYTNARDGAVWAAAQELVARGADPREVNAGLAWNSYHSHLPADKGRAGSAGPYAYHGQRWVALFPDVRDCWIVSLTPIPSIPAQVDSVQEVHGYTTDPIRVYVLRPSQPAHHGCGSR